MCWLNVIVLGDVQSQSIWLLKIIFIWGHHFVNLLILFLTTFSYTKIVCKLFLSWIAYSPDDCLNFKLFSCYDNFVTTGPDPRGPVLQDDESDEEVQEEDNGSEDHYALLVKAWEQKVFPVIRRRFRNEAQRKDGLEQIRGALQLGWYSLFKGSVFLIISYNGNIMIHKNHKINAHSNVFMYCILES